MFRPLAGIILVVLVSLTAHADDDLAAQAAMCRACHTPDSAPAPSGGTGAAPALDRRPAAALAAAMKGFKYNTEPSTIMGRIARGFSDDEIAALASWFAGR